LVGDDRRGGGIGDRDRDAPVSAEVISPPRKNACPPQSSPDRLTAARHEPSRRRRLANPYRIPIPGLGRPPYPRAGRARLTVAQKPWAELRDQAAAAWRRGWS